VNPALSVVFFTTAAGAGYGMLALLGVLAPVGALPATRGFGVTALAAALVLISAGLLSSMLHLGRPERAWRAVSQWRSSWLSREGVAALASYPPALLFGLAWLTEGHPGAPAAVAGVLSAAMAAVTVYCTGMIYASLRPIRQWHNSYVLPLYLLLSLFSGALCLAAVAAFWSTGAMRLLGGLAVPLGAASLVVKLLYWRFIDTKSEDTGRGASTPETATGLGHIGPVRSLEWPHSEENYLLREMGYRIARKHAARLRRVALAAAFALPLVLILVGLAASPRVAGPAATLAALCALAGLYVERWLFFAEATHSVTLYYGRG